MAVRNAGRRHIGLVAVVFRVLALATVLVAIATGSAAQPTVPTYTEVVAPLLWKHCGSCHRPGDLAPFSVFDYRDVRPHARQIVSATSSGRMPPWLPAAEPHFTNERRLSEAEKATLRAWADAGAPEGPRQALPKRSVETDAWTLGAPDLVVQAPRAYTLRPGPSDVFRNIVIPVGLPSGRWVRGIDVNPGNRRVVHHVAIAIDETRGSRRLDDADAEAGFAGGMIAELSARSPQSRALGWTPGMTPSFEVPGMAWRLEAGSDVVLLLHLMPGERAESIRPSVAFYFTDTPPARAPIDVKLGSKSIDIPPGASDYVVEDRMALPVDAELLSIYPHAHYLASRMAVLATLPDGTSKSLLSIREWDFRWQEQYRYADPVELPRGTVITMRYVYDNSMSNRRRPPGAGVRVSYGPLSTDEMGDLWLRLVPRSSEDAATLTHAYLEHELQKDIVRGRRLVASSPENALARLSLGVALLEAQQAADAVGHLREAVRLLPDNDLAQLNLGNALLDLGEVDEAVVRLERAVALNPTAPDGHNNLGIALASKGRVDEAIGHFREALRLRPGYPDAQRNLAQALELRR